MKMLSKYYLNIYKICYVGFFCFLEFKYYGLAGINGIN